MSDEIKLHLEPINERLKEHHDRLHAHGGRLNVLEENDRANTKRLDIVRNKLTATRQELVTKVDGGFAALSAQILAIQTAQAEDRGAKAANDKWANTIFKLLAVLPILYIIITAFKK